MAKKKTRKAPAMAPVIRRDPDRAQAPQSGADPRRPDPDQPPSIGTTGRPSVYSEWLNNTPRDPAPSAWLNSPMGNNAALRSAIKEVGLGPKAASLAARGQAEDQPGPRKRLSTRARKLAEAERIQVDPEAIRSTGIGRVPERGSGREPGRELGRDSGRQLAPTVPGRPTLGATSGGNTPRSTRVMPAMPGGSGLGTSGRIPATRRTGGTGSGTGGSTAGRIPALADQPTARVLASRDTTNQAAIARQATGQVPATRKTGALAPGGSDSGSIVIRGARNAEPTGPIVPRRLRPPSFVMQGVVALATVIVLMGVLTVSSPLGYGAALSGTFQSYASAVKWVPTPTPTATPVPLNTTFGGVPPSPGQQVIVNEIQQVFGTYAQGALNVSHCESGWDPSARNPYPVGNSHAEGVFQILYPSTWDTTSYASQNPYDYNANIHAAWEIFHRDGNSWAEWECQP